ncbi:MAG: AEC family transporter [Oscillospiraceae bacterium]|nr:AEC family transporter [Oscillospiraceae bacterium]
MIEAENFSFLLLLLAGFVMTKAGFERRAFDYLPKILFSLSYPAVILLSFAGMDRVGFGRDVAFIIGFSAAYTVVFYLLAYLFLCRYTNVGRKDLIALYMVVGNQTFVGLPFAAYFFGSWGVQMAILFTVVQDFFIWSLCYWMFAGKGGFKQTARLILNPCFVAVILGAFLMWTGAQIPAIAAPPLVMLADTTIPLALLCIGSLLAQNSGALKAIDRDTVFAVLVKTFIMSVIIFGILTVAGTPPHLIAFSMFVSILPAALLSIIFSKEFNKDVAFANVLFVVSTGLFILVCIGLSAGQRMFGFSVMPAVL